MNSLFRPLELPNGTILKNRLVKSAMSDTLGDGWGNPTPEQGQLYETWAAETSLFPSSVRFRGIRARSNILETWSSTRNLTSTPFAPSLNKVRQTAQPFGCSLGMPER